MPLTELNVLTYLMFYCCSSNPLIIGISIISIFIIGNNRPFLCLCADDSQGWRHYVFGYWSIQAVLMNDTSQQRFEKFSESKISGHSDNEIS